MSNPSSYDKKNQILKMHHMFQKGNQGSNSTDFDLDSLPQHQENLTKIVKSYRIKQDTNMEIKTNSLVSNAKNLLDSQKEDLTQPLYDYVESLKSQLTDKEKEFVEQNLIDEEENETNDITSLLEDEDQTEEKEIPVDIDSLLQSSEKEILNSTDKKQLLKSLIDDININSNKQTFYDESRFEQNMTEIINETKESKVEEIDDTNNEEFIEETNHHKLSSWIIAFVIIIILGSIGYLYRDIVVELFNQLLNNI